MTGMESILRFQQELGQGNTIHLIGLNLACVAGGIVHVRGKILTAESEDGQQSREESGKEPPLHRVGFARATIFRQLRRVVYIWDFKTVNGLFRAEQRFGACNSESSYWLMGCITGSPRTDRYWGAKIYSMFY